MRLLPLPPPPSAGGKIEMRVPNSERLRDDKNCSDSVRSERGSPEGQSPFAGSLRVSLRYNFFSFLYRKESEEGQEEFFRSLLVEKTSASLNSYG